MDLSVVDVGRMRGKTVSPELYHPWVRRFYCPDYHKDQDKIVQPTENGIEVGGHGKMSFIFNY